MKSKIAIRFAVNEINNTYSLIPSLLLPHHDHLTVLNDALPNHIPPIHLLYDHRMILPPHHPVHPLQLLPDLITSVQ